MASEDRYQYSWSGNPRIALLTGAIAAALGFAAYEVEGAIFGKIVLWGIAALMAMVTLGALIYVKIAVKQDGTLIVNKTYGRIIPMTYNEFEPGTVKSVAFDCQMTPGIEGKNLSNASPTPRYRIDLHLEDGVFLVQATGIEGNLRPVAIALAEALGCPFEETGV